MSRGSIKRGLFAALLLALFGSLLIALHSRAYNRRSNPRTGPDAVHSEQVTLGIKNVERLLPQAKRLTIESLESLAHDYEIKDSELKLAEQNIAAVHRVELVDSLGSMAEVDDDSPGEIRIGPEYAQDLMSDDDVAFLLGHELTHVAARNDNLAHFISRVTETTKRRAHVRPTEDQSEDLACDFVGEQVLKRYVSLRPDATPAARRLSHALDYEPDGYDNDTSDDEHLSSSDTLRALFSLDPELHRLLQP